MQQPSSKPSLSARIRAGARAFMGVAPVAGTPPLMAQVEQNQQLLKPSRFDPSHLGGSDSRQAQILNTLLTQGRMPGSPSQNFISADQSIMDLMYQALSPQDPQTATPLYTPGVPLMPIPGVTPPAGPRQWSFTVGGNISMVPRSGEQYGFDDLRAIARIYDGIQICEQVWLDYVSKLNISIELRDELQTEDLDMTKYAKDIQSYTDFFAYPDKQRDIKSWLRLAVKEQLEVDALAIYPHLTNDGHLFALEILDGSTIKPLFDDRGRRPEVPFPAYEQYLYGGIPAAWLNTDELIYMVETERTNSMYGTSRVEKILMRANQALRKQSKDLLRYTEGTVPAGVIQVPSDSPWTQDQLEEFEINLNALMAGNDMARARLKVLPKGFIYLPTDDPAIQTLFDTFLLNITTSAFGLTMAELGFTENVNKSSGDSQENVVYRRTMVPLISRYEDLFTYILRKYFNETRFVVKFKGFEEVEDLQAKASTYLSLVTAGIQSPTQAAQALHLPVYDDQNVPPFVMTKTGPFVVSDLANDDVRAAMTAAQLAAVAPPKPAPAGSMTSAEEDDETQTTTPPDDQQAAKTDTPDASQPPAKKGVSARSEASIDYRRWRERAIADTKAHRQQRGFTTQFIPPAVHSHITWELNRCQTPDDVRAVFSRAAELAPDTGSWQIGDPDIQRSLDGMRANGTKTLTWKTLVNPCDQCSRNADATVNIGEPFPTGALTVPNHKNCNCSVIEGKAS